MLFINLRLFIVVFKLFVLCHVFIIQHLSGQFSQAVASKNKIKRQNQRLFDIFWRYRTGTLAFRGY